MSELVRTVLRVYTSLMQWSGLVLAFTIANAASVSATGPENPLVQSTNSSKPQSGVVVKKLVTPTYPPIARQTGVQGDVIISLGIRADSSVESEVVKSGHPLLQQAALESAQHSEHECLRCTESVTPFSLSYTFQIQPDEGCDQIANASPRPSPAEAEPTSPKTQPPNHVLIVAQRFCIIDYGPDHWKVRSAKCLYLWKCGWKP